MVAKPAPAPQPVQGASPVQQRAPVVVKPALAPQPVKDTSPVQERASVVVKPAPTPAPAAVQPERARAPAAAPVVVERQRSSVESRAPADQPATANRPVTDARDGSAIIDWLLENRR